jgi:hypothetical protein
MRRGNSGGWRIGAAENHENGRHVETEKKSVKLAAVSWLIVEIRLLCKERGDYVLVKSIWARIRNSDGRTVCLEEGNDVARRLGIHEKGGFLGVQSRGNLYVLGRRRAAAGAAARNEGSHGECALFADNVVGISGVPDHSFRAKVR